MFCLRVCLDRQGTLAGAAVISCSGCHCRAALALRPNSPSALHFWPVQRRLLSLAYGSKGRKGGCMWTYPSAPSWPPSTQAPQSSVHPGT